jgi:hypothetical protein
MLINLRWNQFYQYYHLLKDIMNYKNYSINTVSFISVIALCLNCSNDQSSITKSFEPEISTATLHIISGNHQLGIGNTELSEPIVIQVVDKEGKPVPNLQIIFDMIEGEGDLTKSMPVISDQSGTTQVGWIIGESYNAVKVSLVNDEIDADPIFIYATGDKPEGMAITRSLNSLRREGNNFYSMLFYGDYSEIVNGVNRYFTGNNLSKPIMEYNCSLFSAFGNDFLFGRSFDNPAGWECLTLLGEYNPPNGYKSYALSRMQDYGYQIGTDIENLTDEDKIRLFESAGHVPDGINECGVVVGLANVQAQNYNPDLNKDFIWVTVLVRKILDHASNIDEAIAIANEYNIACPDNNTLGIHILIADTSGQSVILEMGNGVLQSIHNTNPWQVITNSPSFNVSIEAQKEACPRFEYIYHQLDVRNGNISVEQGMHMLNFVGNTSTEWSAMYNLMEKSIRVAIDFDFDTFFDFQLE